MRMKRLLLLGMLPFFVIAACKSVVPLQSDKEEPVYTGTLRVGLHSLFWKKDPYSPGSKPMSRDDILQQRSLAFMEKHPGVKIEFIDVDYKYNYQDLLEDPSQMPDVIELTVNEARLSMRDRIVSLAERIEEHAAWWDGDYRQVIDLAELDEEAFLLPITSNPMLVFYDPQLFATLGIPKPHEGWTYGEFTALGTQLAAKGYPMYLPPDTLTTMEPIIRGLGGTLAAPDLRAVSGYLDSDATAGAFAQYAAMLKDLTGGTGEAGVERTFGMLRASQMLVGPGIAPIPTSVEGVRHNNALMTGLAISKDSRQQELAWAYVTHLVGDTSDEAMEFVVTNTLDSEEFSNRFERVDPEYVTKLKTWMKHAIATAEPAAFYMVFHDNSQGPRDDTVYVPQRSLAQLLRYADPETARADLKQWAQEIEMQAPFLAWMRK